MRRQQPFPILKQIYQMNIIVTAIDDTLEERSAAGGGHIFDYAGSTVVRQFFGRATLDADAKTIHRVTLIHVRREEEENGRLSSRH